MKKSTKVSLIAVAGALGLLCTVSVTYLAVASYTDRKEAKEAAEAARREAFMRQWKEEACDYGAGIAMNMVDYRNQGVVSYRASMMAMAAGDAGKDDLSGKKVGVMWATDDDVMRYVYYTDPAPTREDTRRFALDHCRVKMFDRDS